MRMRTFTRNGCIHLQQTTIRNMSSPAHTRSIERRMMCEVPRELPQRQHVLATHDHRAHPNRLPSSHQPAAPARTRSRTRAATFPHPRRHVPAPTLPPHAPDIHYFYNFRALLLLITLHLWQNSGVDKIMYSLWGGCICFSCVHVSLSTRKGSINDGNPN